MKELNNITQIIKRFDQPNRFGEPQNYISPDDVDDLIANLMKIQPEEALKLQKEIKAPLREILEKPPIISAALSTTSVSEDEQKHIGLIAHALQRDAAETK